MSAAVIPFPRYRVRRLRSLGVLEAWRDLDAARRIESALYATCVACAATLIGLCLSVLA